MLFSYKICCCLQWTYSFRNENLHFIFFICFDFYLVYKFQHNLQLQLFLYTLVIIQPIMQVVFRKQDWTNSSPAVHQSFLFKLIEKCSMLKFRSGSIRSVQISSNQFSSFQFNSGQMSSAQVRSVQINMWVLIAEGVPAPLGLYPPALLRGADTLDVAAGGMSDDDCGSGVAERGNQNQIWKKN